MSLDTCIPSREYFHHILINLGLKAAKAAVLLIGLVPRTLLSHELKPNKCGSLVGMIRLVLFFLVTLVSALASAQTPISIATGGTGGTYYPVGGGYAELINAHVEGYSAVAEVTGGAVENVGLVSRGEADIAFAVADTAYWAYRGELDGLPELSNLRAIGVAYFNTVHIVTVEGMGISQLSDVVGKRVSIGSPGAGRSAITILEANGISLQDIHPQRLNFNETAMALRDSQIDVGFISVGAPTSALLDLATAR